MESVSLFLCMLSLICADQCAEHGKIDDKDMLNEHDIREKYNGLNVNLAELLGLRLYTGAICFCILLLKKETNRLLALNGVRPCVCRTCGLLRSSLLCICSIISAD